MTRRLKVVINVPKQGKEHHQQMVNWCNESLGDSVVRWFGYDLGAHKTTIFHFFTDEDATAFLIRWGGSTGKS